MMSKRKKVKLPKRIAGVKLPKATRKGPIVDFLNSSGGQVLLAEALVLAAGVFGARRVAAQAGAPWDPGTRETLHARTLQMPLPAWRMRPVRL
jgi:hypothetical protein